MTDHPFQAIEPFLKRFEEAFRNNKRLSIQECLPKDEDERRVALIELAHTELELRISQGELVRASDYFEIYPELAHCHSIAADLVVTEFRACRRAAGVKEEDFFARYPTLRESLIVRFGGPVEPSIPVPGRVGRYRLQTYIGQGSFGIVYRGRDEWLNRDVAVKLLIDRSPEAGDQFVREARLAARLQHAGIVSVYDAGFHDGRGYIILEYVAGATLTEIIKLQQMTFIQAVSLVIALGRAVHYAHEQGITHRDIKPGNVLINSAGEPRLTDFGLAVGPSYTSRPIAAGIPESNVPTSDIERQLDINGLGVLLDILLKECIPNGRNWSSSLQHDIREIIRVACSADTRRHYPTAQALSDDLARLVAGLPVSVNPPTIIGSTIRRVQQKPINTLLTAGILFSLLLAIASWQIADRNHDRANRTAKTNQITIRELTKYLQTGGAPEERHFRRLTAETVVRSWKDHLAINPDDATASSELAYAQLVFADQLIYAGHTEQGVQYAQEAWNWYSRHAPDRIDAGRAGMLLARSLARLGKTNEATILTNTIFETAKIHHNEPLWWAISIEAFSFLYQLNTLESPAPIIPNISEWAQGTPSVISCGYASVGYLSRDHLGVSLNLLSLIDSLATIKSMDHPRRWERAAALTSAGESAFSQRQQQAEAILRSALDEWNVVRPRDSLGLWLFIYTQTLLVQLDSKLIDRAEVIKALSDAIKDFEYWTTATPYARDHRYRLALCYRSMAKLMDVESPKVRFFWYQKASIVLHRLISDYRDDIEYQNMYALTLHRMAVCCRIDHRPHDGLKFLEEAMTIHRFLATGNIDKKKYEAALKSDLLEKERLQR
jgi:serine/threonine protein kinase